MFIAIYSDESVLKDAATLDNFLRNSASFKLEHTKKKTGSTRDDGTKNVEIMVPLKYLSDFFLELLKYHQLILKLLAF